MRSKNRVSKIPEKKTREVEVMKNLIKTRKTILLASIKNIPASQFQEISKKLRGKAEIKVPKKNLIFMALDSSGKEAVKKLKEKISDNTAILFSDLDSFELAAELIRNKTPAKAKPGQEAPEDIIIEAGPTDLVPGPAITELGALGIQIQIEKGKINIKVAKTIAKKGEKISKGAAELMSKLDIKPFKIGFIPVCSLDVQNEKIYLDIKIDPEETIENLKKTFSKALAFAVAIEYPCEDTIKLLISKAAGHERALNSILTQSHNKEGEN
ncbi:MAG: 50S ribosomal protein L10 [Nanoarchaeota archaeon]